MKYHQFVLYLIIHNDMIANEILIQRQYILSTNVWYYYLKIDSCSNYPFTINMVATFKLFKKELLLDIVNEVN